MIITYNYIGGEEWLPLNKIPKIHGILYLLPVSTKIISK